MGVGTPGVGEYKEKVFTDEGPKYTVPLNERFKIPPPATKNCAHAYLTPLLYL